MPASDERPKYRPLTGGAVEVPQYCAARNHLARVGTRTLVGVTRGALPVFDRSTPIERLPLCSECLAAYLALPEALRPGSAVDV